MTSLRMNTKDVLATGFSFLIVIAILHVIIGILLYIGIWLFTTYGWEWGLLFWIPAIFILIAGYIGIWSKLLTDSIALGIYKGNNAGDNVDLEIKLPWEKMSPPVVDSEIPPMIEISSMQQTPTNLRQSSEDSQWKL